MGKVEAKVVEALLGAFVLVLVGKKRGVLVLAGVEEQLFFARKVLLAQLFR